MDLTPGDYGLNITRLIAGFSGGVVNAMIFRQVDAYEVVGSVVTGTLTANFLTPAAIHYLPDWISDGAAAFLVGLSAMAICQGIIALIRRKIDGGGPTSTRGSP